MFVSSFIPRKNIITYSATKNKKSSIATTSLKDDSYMYGPKPFFVKVAPKPGLEPGTP